MAKMNRAELMRSLENHPKFDVDRLFELAGDRLTNDRMFSYLCELEGWRPLEVATTSNPDWLLVASTSTIGLWHRTSLIHKSCDCQHGFRFSSGRCCHLAAAARAEESHWINQAEGFGFSVSVDNGEYLVYDRASGILVGKLRQAYDNSWVLIDPRRKTEFGCAGVSEAIEYLAAAMSF